VAPGDLVLDLGAGNGALSWPMLDVGARVIAVELHDRRVDELQCRLLQLGARCPDQAARLTIVQRDLRQLWLPGRPFRVVASPPYALTAEVLRRLMTSDRMRSADLVLQFGAARGVCERGLRGLHARRYRAELGLTVPRRAFIVAPSNDSVVLQIRHR
jgi:23S rRNA (adenine-N6)-dimethyltransferase